MKNSYRIDKPLVGVELINQLLVSKGWEQADIQAFLAKSVRVIVDNSNTNEIKLWICQRSGVSLALQNEIDELLSIESATDKVVRDQLTPRELMCRAFNIDPKNPAASIPKRK